MVNRFIIQLITEYGARVTKSVFNAYQKVINQSKITAKNQRQKTADFLSFLVNILGLDPNSGFSKAASSTLGRFVTKPMTRDEACKILNIEEKPELDHLEVMEVSWSQIFNIGNLICQ